MIDIYGQRLLVIVLLGVVGTGCARSSRTAPAAEAAAPPEEVVTLLHDVRDFVVRPLPTSSVVYDEHGWPQLDTRPSTASDRAIDALKDLVMTIDPVSWRERANGPGIVDDEAGQLIVTQTPENQERVRRLLAQLRETRSVQVALQTYVIRGANAGDQIDRAGCKWHQAGEAAQFVYVTGGQMRSLLKTRPAGVELLTAPRLTVFNGQRAHVIVANETPYVAGYEPVDIAFEGRRLEPVTKTVYSGVVIDCCPTVSSDRRYVTLTLLPRLSTLRDLTSTPWPGAPEDRADLKVQVPHLTTAAVNVTVSVPDQGWVLVRTTPQHQPPDANAPPTEPVLFAFGATVIESLRE